MATAVWVMIFVLLVVFEAATMALTTIWFAGGALVGFVLSLCGASILVQIRAGLIVSLVLLICTRPLAIKYVNRKNIKTNTELIPGELARVSEPISNINNTGVAILNGLEWTARAEDESVVIPVGAVVKVVKIDGVKLIVKQLISKEEN